MIAENTQFAFVSENTVSVETSTSNQILTPKVVTKLCRLCLEEKQTMWSFFSIVTFNDGSTMDVSYVFQDLTREDTEKMENPKLPPYICEQCLDLLLSAHAFQKKYRKSIQILNEYLAKKFEENEEVVCENLEMEMDDQYVIKSDEEESNISNNSESTVRSSDIDVLPSSVKKNYLAPHVYVTDRTREKITSFPTVQEVITKVSNESTSVKLHRCPICPKFFTALELKKHCHTHKTLKTYLKMAPKYNKKVKFYAIPRTESKGLFNQRKIIHTCPFCQVEFESEPFRDHIKLHRSEGNFRCNICNRIFLGINHLKMHQLSHKKEAPFKCNFCSKAFFLKRNYDFHLLRHSDDNDLPFKCEYCEKTFSNPEHLKRHRFSHENVVSYTAFYKREMLYVKCNQCQQKFKSEEEKAIHSCRLCCARCHKLFDSKTKFNSHVCITKLKISQCLRCGKVFQLPSSLKAHKYRCSKRTLCYVCGKNVANITQHLATHYPNKKSKTSFKCAQCNKLFSYKENLRRHITEVHMNIVRYQCQYCSKGFKGKWNLQVHERIHSGIKAHVCAICNKGFLENSYLKKHLKVHLRTEDLVDFCVN